MIKITYPGTGNYSTFSYDGYNRNVAIIETTSGSVTSTKQFVWDDDERCEQRDASGAYLAQFYERGEIISGSSYFYVGDHLSSIREMSNTSGSIQSEYSYDPFGNKIKIAESIAADFAYAGYLSHSRSGLSLTPNRSYSSSQARWLSRDPVPSPKDPLLYAYVMNAPTELNDPLGLMAGSPGVTAPRSKPHQKKPPPPPDPSGSPFCTRGHHPPRRRPPPRNDGGDPPCHPPQPGANPSVTTVEQCSEWCQTHCRPSRVEECQDECWGLYPIGPAPYPPPDN